MTTDNTNDITPEKVKELLEGITNKGDWMIDSDGDDAIGVCSADIYNRDQICWTEDLDNRSRNTPFIAAAPSIARAYIEKCEEVELWKKRAFRQQDANQHLQITLDGLNGNIDSMQQTNQAMGRKLLDLAAIIDKQREVLDYVVGETDDELIRNKAKKALALAATDKEQPL